MSGVSVIAFMVAGCGTTFSGSTVAQQTTSWASSTGLTASTKLLNGDLRRVAAQQSAPPGTLRTACDVLVTDALAANQNLPSPDPTLTSLLAAAYSVAGSAGHDCLTGAGGNAALLARSGRERVTAERDIIKAQARYDRVTTGFGGGS
jgi:hypothetical protein